MELSLEELVAVVSRLPVLPSTFSPLGFVEPVTADDPGTLDGLITRGLLGRDQRTVTFEPAWRRAIEVLWAPLATIDIVVQRSDGPRRGLFWTDGAWTVEAFLTPDRFRFSRALRNELVLSMVARGLGVGHAAVPGQLLPRALLRACLVLAPAMGRPLDESEAVGHLQRAAQADASEVVDALVTLGPLERTDRQVCAASAWAPYWKVLATAEAASVELRTAHPAVRPVHGALFGPVGHRALLWPTQLEGTALYELSFPGVDRLAALLASRVTVHS